MAEKKKVQLGLVYSAKCGGSWLPVRIDKSLGHGRYEGVAMSDGRTVKVATAAVKGDGQTVEAWNAAHAPKPEDAPTPAPAATTGKRKAAKEKKERKPGGLEAAVRVLREAGTPLNCGDMVKTALEKGYWQTGGKTPAATVYAAIIREIAAKADASRFAKTRRGMFTLKA